MIAKKVAQSGVHDNVPPKVKSLAPIQRLLVEAELAGEASKSKKAEEEKKLEEKKEIKKEDWIYKDGSTSTSSKQLPPIIWMMLKDELDVKK